MTFPTGTQISTTNVATSDADPSLARADIYDLIVAFNQLVASVNAASGVLSLDGGGKVAANLIPGNLNITGSMTLQPSTGIINIRNVLRLREIYTNDLPTFTGTTAPSAGDLIYLADGDAGQPCLACNDGAVWRVVRLMTQVGDVGASLTSTAELICEVDA